jgi:LysR family transcriptional regulator, regulator for bpeEF and oprC
VAWTMHSMNTQTLTVQVPASFGQLLIAPALPRLLVMHPDLRVTMIEVESGPEHWVREADAAVCIGPVVDRRRVVRQLGVVHPLTCASPERIERTGIPIAPADLAPSDCIALLEFRTRRPRAWAFRRGSTSLTISPAGPLAFVQAKTAIAAAVHGGGYIRVRSFEADRQIAAGLLRPVLEEWNDLPLPVTLVRPRGRIVGAPALVFAEFVAGLLPNYNGSTVPGAVIAVPPSRGQVPPCHLPWRRWMPVGVSGGRIGAPGRS